MKKISPYFPIITQDDSIKEPLITLISEFPTVEYKLFNTIGEFFVEKSAKPLSGIFVDFKLAMKLTTKERDELSLLDSLIPYFKVRVNPNGQLAGIGSIKFGEGDAFFKTLFNESLSYSPKKLRNHIRQDIYLNVLISISEKFSSENSFRSNSSNISIGGVFIIAPNEWNITNKIWVKFEDFKEIEPIECYSQWHLSWGLGYKALPGYGLEYVNLSQVQTELINKIIFQSGSSLRK